jgi:tetratricopeptide (TPR) repeat protein
MWRVGAKQVTEIRRQREGDEIRPLTEHGPGISQPPASFITGRWPLAILFLLAALPYLGVLGNDFVYIFDDKSLIIDNPYVHNFHHLRELFTSTLWANLGPQQSAPYYRPVATGGFLLCYHVFGASAWGFHLVSLLLNAGVVVVLFLLVERLLSDRVTAFAAAALFALHPVHVEAVAWISDAADLEVTLLYLLTFWCFLRVADPAGGSRFGVQALMTASFALAVLSKEQAMTLPLLATVYEHFYRRDLQQTRWVQKALRYAPLWIVMLAYLTLRTHVLGSFAHATRMHELSAQQVILSALALVGQYTAILFLPIHLSAFHAFHPSASILDKNVLLGVLAIIFFAALFGFLWKRCRPASFGILWLMITLAPVLNARWLSYYVLAERYLYLPSVGFCLVAGWACALLWQSSSGGRTPLRTAFVAAACVLAALCVLRISLRLLDWRSDITLFTQALAQQPGDFRLHDALGAAYWLRENSKGAEREWQATLRLEPDSVQALESLGALYAQQRRYDKATPLLEQALRLDPRAAAAHLRLGAVYAQTGKLDLAEEQFRAAVLLAPTNFNAHNLLGKVYFDSKRLTEAERQFRESLQCEPNLAAYDHLGYIYEQWRHYGRAEKTFNNALAMNSSDTQAHYHLGMIYAATGRKAQALHELQAAQAADPGNPEIRSALKKFHP